MTRSELCARVAALTSPSKADIAAALGALNSTISDALAQGETVTVVGFGKLAARTRAARQGRNPRTGEPVAVPAARVSTFKAAKAFAMRSTHSEPSSVDNYSVLVQVAQTRLGNAFATEARRHAAAGMLECPRYLRLALSHAAAPLQRRFRLPTRDGVPFGPQRRRRNSEARHACHYMRRHTRRLNLFARWYFSALELAEPITLDMRSRWMEPLPRTHP